MAQSNTKSCPTCRKVQIMQDVDVCAVCSNKGRVAQSNEQGGEELDNILNVFDGGIHAKGSEKGGYPTYFTEPYPLWLAERKDYAKKRLQRLLAIDRKQHELEARLDEISHVFSIDEPHTDIHGKHPKVISVSERLAELKAKRERLGK